MLRGIATVNFWADDLPAAKTWYADLLGVEPYFERAGADGRPAYYEFRLGDHQHELGLIDSRYAPPGATTGPGGAVVYWHVDDLPATVARLLAAGAREHDPIRERGTGFVTASVVDPFGNVLGVMTNPHYLEMLAKRS
ncbi:VOC family protein [Micromonospora purpureochromogenes]|uniref:Enzyme related to lactoylglutathione lyase n=1 Tax=Micromonospora purpureochromogenes TaxID=47872 RepID=A0ABX2RSF7_9ACTN|nr:VOC family protein [Micromonospora purpureochromogenes]NYF59477.1 putative enzyme related to lactoylglutathione lyase [Micromonospora purpureochromogenes]